MRLGTSFLILLLLTLSLGLTAQTRRIAHRSHSGVPAAFAALLDDDHGGNPVPDWDRKDEKWNVHPFIAKVRKHYESEGDKVKKADNPKAETKDSVRVLINGWGDPQVIPPDENKKAPQEASIIRIPKQSTDQDSSNPAAAALPEITPFRLAHRNPDAPAKSNLSLWILAAGLILTVPTSIYWATRKGLR